MSEVLIHWGVKGQKWGVRRYQNPDGSLTPAGKKRYGDDYELSEDYVKSRSKPTSAMSNKELQEHVNRLRNEEAYEGLTTPKKSAGAKFAGKFLEKLGDKAIEKTVNTIGDKVMGPYAEKAIDLAGYKIAGKLGKSTKGRRFMSTWCIKSKTARDNERRYNERKEKENKLMDEAARRLKIQGYKKSGVWKP